MAVFSENQVRHLFVEKSLKSGRLVQADPVGTLAPINDTQSQTSAGAKTLWFGYVGADNNMITSDKITLANVVSAKATASGKMARPLNRVKVTIKPEALTTGTLSSGNIIAGQDYILRLAFNHYIGMSDEDSQYWKYGMVHGYAGMKPDAFYKALALSLAQNLSRDENKLVKVYVHSASKGADYSNATTGTAFAEGFMEVTPRVKDNGVEGVSNPYYVNSALVDDIDSIEIEAIAQPWELGTISQEVISFQAQPTTIRVAGDDIIWGKVEKSAAEAVMIENGHDIADLEYFCMGERGDIYRNVGWPYTIRTKYMVDPDKKYDVLDIVYFYAGPNEDIQKSQKTLTIVVEDDNSHTLMNALINRINTVSGLAIATL